MNFELFNYQYIYEVYTYKNKYIIYKYVQYILRKSHTIMIYMILNLNSNNSNIKIFYISTTNKITTIFLYVLKHLYILFIKFKLYIVYIRYTNI